MKSFQKQASVLLLPAFSIYRKSAMQEADLNGIARLVESALPRFMRGDISAEVTLSEEDLKIMADTALMQLALTNLVKNAVDAMPNGGLLSLDTRRVHFGGESLFDRFNFVGGSCALLSVADTGIGIDEKTKERIFEPFFTTKAGSGAGLGLPIAYHIIKEHSGSINVGSTPGQGTTINVYLPLAKGEMVSMMPIPLQAQCGKAHTQLLDFNSPAVCGVS
jgi:two-component system, cell cycle sensor histidine kinase and response regulator CckA